MTPDIPAASPERRPRSLDLAARNVRAATTLARARPAYAAGLRAALATVAPLALGPLMGTAMGGTWMSLAGFTGALSDKGGSYGTRAAAIATVTAFGALTVFVGAIGSTHPSIAAVLTFVVAILCSLARAWGNMGATVGGSVLTMFVVSLAFPASGLTDALARAGFVLVGGVWAAFLSLVLWPLRPYRPARLAIVDCFRAVATYVDDVIAHLESLPPPPPSPSPAPAPTDPGILAGSLVVRTALEHAREVLATIRRGRPGESRRGERLLVLRETADQIFGNLIAVADVVDAIPADVHDARRHEAVVSALRETAALLRELALRVEEERQADVAPVTVSGTPVRALAPTDPAALTSADARYAEAQYDHAALLLDRIATFAGVAAANVAALDGGHVAAPVSLPETEEPTERQSLIAPLRSVLAHDSLVLRHAFRVGVVTAIAAWLTSVLALPRGYWVTITAVIILQPYTGATTVRAVQRVIGTVLGAMITAALGALFHDPRAILVLAFIFSAVSVALLPLNYTAFSVFLTPTFVLLAEASAGDWHLAGTRVLDTVIGGALALIGARLLWPAPEWKRLPTYLSAVLDADRDYLLAVARTFTDRSDAAGRLLRERRRHAALAAINAEESFQRVLGEHAGHAGDLASVMTVLTYARRFLVSTAALAVSRHAVDPAVAAVIVAFGDAAASRLDAAARRLSGDEPSDAAPTTTLPDVGALDPVVRARLTRLARQLDTLTSAAADVAVLGVVPARAAFTAAQAPA